MSTAPRTRLPAIDVPAPLDQVIAVLALEPEELSRTRDLGFQDSYDDLDDLKVAIVATERATYALVRHRNSPSPGTEVHAPAGNPELALSDLLTKLKLSEADVLWTRPKART